MSTNNLKTVEHHDSQVNTIINQLKDINLDGSYYLMLLTGPYKRGKKIFIDKLASELGKKVTLVNMHDIVTMNEKESEQNIDSLFESLTNEDEILFFLNGDRLCGAYAGYTYSRVRYATPQERYMLDWINKLEKIVILDIVEEHNVDKTLQRYSHVRISFERPASIFKRFIWKLGKTDFHGHNFTSQRPA